MEEYFQKTSLNGFGLLYSIRRRKYQRFFWFLFILLGCGFATYVVLYIIISFLENPTVTSFSSTKEIIWRLPFPGLSLCSVNQLSRHRVELYALYLSKRSHNSVDFWKEKLRFLAGYYDSVALDYDDSTAFETSMKNLLGDEYNARSILKDLAPSCNDLLLECYWSDNLRNCSELFEMVPTISGHCCMFNYQKDPISYEDEIINNNTLNKTFYPNSTGMHGGLTVLLNASTKDYFYKTRNSNGFHLNIFDAHTFPDITTGGVEELMIPPGSDVDVELSITTQTADEGARRFAVSNRRCYFEDESQNTHELTYSHSECLSRCRLQETANICKCAPFFTPEAYLGDKNVTVCSLVYSECLAHFFVAWRIYRPMEFEGTTKLTQEIISCKNCYPLCRFHLYSYSKQMNSLAKTHNRRCNRKYFSNFPNNTHDLSLVKIYFPHQEATQINKNVLYNWYQILSNVGGVIGICMGCSIISGFEILYFFTYKLFINFIKLIKVHSK